MAPGRSPWTGRADEALSFQAPQEKLRKPARRTPPLGETTFKCFAAGPDVLAPAPPPTMHRKGAAEQTPSIRLPRSIPLFNARSSPQRWAREGLVNPARERMKDARYPRLANQIMAADRTEQTRSAALTKRPVPCHEQGARSSPSRRNAVDETALAPKRTGKKQKAARPDRRRGESC
jgi:hypothetical protein